MIRRLLFPLLAAFPLLAGASAASADGCGTVERPACCCPGEAGDAFPSVDPTCACGCGAAPIERAPEPPRAPRIAAPAPVDICAPEFAGAVVFSPAAVVRAQTFAPAAAESPPLFLLHRTLLL